MHDLKAAKTNVVQNRPLTLWKQLKTICCANGEGAVEHRCSNQIDQEILLNNQAWSDKSKTKIYKAVLQAIEANPASSI